MTEFRTLGAAEFGALGRRMKSASNGALIRAALLKQLRNAGKPVVRDVQTEVRGLVVKGARGGGRKQRAAAWTKKSGPRGGHGLRAAAARTVKLKVRVSGKSTGITIWSDASSMPAGQQKLPAYMNDPKGWRHPVFGNRHAWAKQVGGQWFEPPIIRNRSQFQTAIRQAVAEAMRQLRA